MIDMMAIVGWTVALFMFYKYERARKVNVVVLRALKDIANSQTMTYAVSRAVATLGLIAETEE